jgi:hypothetical protein
MVKPRFVIRAQTANLRVEVWVNDIPVSYLLCDQASSPVAIPVNQYLVKGKNAIRVVLHPGPVPSRALDSWASEREALGYTGTASLSLRFAKESTGQEATAQNGGPLVAISWQGLAATQPLPMEREFMLDEPAGPWAWETATRFRSLDSAVREQASNYVRRLYGLLAAKQFDAYILESSTKLDELTEGAYGAPAEPMRRGMLRALQDHSEAPYKLQPLEISDEGMRLVAGGRMIECLRKDRRHLLEYVHPGQDGAFFLPTMIGKVDSVWKILR